MPLSELTNPEFLALLNQKGIQMQARGGRLHLNAPAGTVLPELREELSRRKPQLLALLGFPSPPLMEILRAPRGAVIAIPQTPSQQGLWLFDHFNPGNVAYNLPSAFLVTGGFDLKLLQASVDRLLLRHEVLCTSFFQDSGELLQRVSTDARTEVKFTDLSADPGSLESLLPRHALQPFQLDRPPLIRFHLFRLGDGRDVLLSTVHHIVADGPSLSILHRDLRAIYGALRSGSEPDLPRMAVQFADYAVWAARQLGTETMQGQLRYWQKQLAGTPPFLELAHSRPSPVKRSAWGATRSFLIDDTLRSRMLQIAQGEGATLFLALLAAFGTLLYTWSGQTDFCIGSPITHRKHPQTEQLVGMFAHMLALRCRPDPRLGFSEFLQQVRSVALEAFENSDVPFQKVLRALKPERREGRSPVFQVLFAFQPEVKAAPDPQASPQCAVEVIDMSLGTARYDVALDLIDHGREGIAGRLEYCTDLFSEADAARLEKSFLLVLHEVTCDAKRPVGEIAAEVHSRFMPVPTEPPPALQPKQGQLRTLFERVKRWADLESFTDT